MRSLGAQQYSRLPCMLPHRGALVVECKAPADNSCDCPCRGLLNETVRSMILAPGNGAEVKGIIPVAQWQKVVSILVSLVDCVELPLLAATACEDCQVGEAVPIFAAFLILFNITAVLQSWYCYCHCYYYYCYDYAVPAERGKSASAGMVETLFAASTRETEQGHHLSLVPWQELVECLCWLCRLKWRGMDPLGICEARMWDTSCSWRCLAVQREIGLTRERPCSTL